MTVRERGVSRASRWVAAALAAVVVCSAAGVALAASGAVVNSRDGRLGWMLTARNGHTLYLWHQDLPGKSYCYGACAKTWTPDITYGRPTTPSGSDVNPKLLGTSRRRNGQLQVTYNGHPLYLYAGDTTAGAIHGELQYQFGGYWHAVGIDGKAVFDPGNY